MKREDSLLGKIMFSSREHGQIILNETPESSKKDGVLAVEAHGKYGKFYFAEVIDELYSFRFGVFDLADDLTLTTVIDTNYLGFFVNLGGEIRYAQEGVSKGVIEKDDCCLIGIPYLHSKTRLRKNTSYAFFDICFSSSYLQHWKKTFTSLSIVLSKMQRDIPVFEIFRPPNGEGRPLEIVKDLRRLVRTDYKPEDGKNRVSVVLHQLFDVYDNLFSRAGISDDELEKFYEVREMLISSPQNAITLRKLALEMGMNEFKLKTWFKKLFGRPVLKFFFEVRMERAMELLNERKRPIYEIAAMVGYKNVASFSAAFKKKFGYPPSSIR